MKLLVIGNPFDGMKVYGPVADLNTLEVDKIQDDWWIVDLNPMPNSPYMPTPLHPEAQQCFDHDPWCEHATIGREDWRDEVANNDTSLGYWEWLTVKLQQRDEDESGGN